MEARNLLLVRVDGSRGRANILAAVERWYSRWYAGSFMRASSIISSVI